MGKRPCVTLSCVKTCFLVCVALLWLTAAGMLGVGIWTLVAKNNYEALLGSVTYVATAGLMVASGLFGMFVCIFGMFGAFRESRFMVLGFLLMMAIVLLLELIPGILAYIYRSNVRSELGRSMDVTIATQYGLDGQETKTDAVDRLQKIYHCCGDIDYSSWQKSQWKKSNISGEAAVPDSCCISPSKICGKRIHPSNIWRNDLHPMGCFSKLERYIYDHLLIMGIVGIAVGCAQISSLILAFWMYRLIVESYF